MEYLKKPFSERACDSELKKSLNLKPEIYSIVRRFFKKRGFLEIETPLLVRSPGMETHIRPMQALSHAKPKKRSFLQTSPEFAMKKLLGPLERDLFQLCKVFRDEPASTTHLPEFTMLEWYRRNASYEEIMIDTEELISSLVSELHGKPKLQFQGISIDLTPPWPRKTVRELFQEHASLDLTHKTTHEELIRALPLGSTTARDNWEDLFFRVWLNQVEPKLPKTRPIIVTEFPAQLCALSVLEKKPDQTLIAKRFEFFIGGLELGNAFQELTDAGEQRIRFEKDMKTRGEIYGGNFPSSPIDEEFMESLSQGMPKSSGIAVGMDRLLMLIADLNDIRKTVLPEPWWEEEAP